MTVLKEIKQRVFKLLFSARAEWKKACSKTGIRCTVHFRPAVFTSEKVIYRYYTAMLRMKKYASFF
jgi:hypothetical protein